MIFSNANKYRYPIFFLVLILIIGLMAAYFSLEFKFLLNSDDAVRSILVKIARSKESWLVTEWVYANGDLYLATPYLINLLVSHFVADGIAANAISSFAGYLILLICYYYFCKQVDWKTAEVPVLSTIFLGCGISASNLEFVESQGIYSLYSGLTVLIVAIVLRARSAGTWFLPRLLLLSSICFVLTIANPRRALAQVILPLAVACLMLVLRGGWRGYRNWTEGKSVAMSLVGIITAFLFSSAVYYWILFPQIMNLDAAASLNLISASDLFSRVLDLPLAWFAYLQPQPSAERISFYYKSLSMASVLISVGLILGPALACARFKSLACTKQFVLLFALSNFFIAAGSMLISKNLFIGYGEIRYLTVAIICFIPFSLDLLAGFIKQRRTTFFAIGLFLSYSVAISCLWIWPPRSVAEQRHAIFNQRLQLVRDLENAGVCKALATYWNSYTNSLVGNFSVWFYPVEMREYIRPQPHHSYRGPSLAACEKSALLVAQQDLTPSLKAGIAFQFGTPISETSFGSNRIMVFDADIYQELLKEQIPLDVKLRAEDISVRVSRSTLTRCAEAPECRYELGVENTGTAVLTSKGKLPIRLGIRSLDSSDRVIAKDEGRADFPVPLPPGRKIEFELPSSIFKAGVNKVQLCLLQEGVSWYCDRTIGDL